MGPCDLSLLPAEPLPMIGPPPGLDSLVVKRPWVVQSEAVLGTGRGFLAAEMSAL